MTLGGIRISTPSGYNRLIVVVLVCIILTTFVLNYFVDPFNKNEIFKLNFPKATVSYRMNYPLYKLLEYSKRPKEVIILGDSRANLLKETFFKEAGLISIYNFGYGGGTLFEAVDTFWYASRQIKLQKVIMCIPFNIYSESERLNRFNEAEKVSENIFLYYLSALVTETSILNILTYVTGREYKSEVPPMSKDRFWEYQLGHGTFAYYSNWKKPNALYGKLREVADFCSSNNIELIIVLPPTHLDLQKKAIEFGLYEQYLLYKKDLEKLGVIFDFDFPNNVTSDRNNFSDPYHFNQMIARRIVIEIVGYFKHNTSLRQGASFGRILQKTL